MPSLPVSRLKDGDAIGKMQVDWFRSIPDLEDKYRRWERGELEDCGANVVFSARDWRCCTALPPRSPVSQLRVNNPARLSEGRVMRGEKD